MRGEGGAGLSLTAVKQSQDSYFWTGTPNFLGNIS